MRVEKEILELCNDILLKYTKFDIKEKDKDYEITSTDYTMLRTLIALLITIKEETKNKSCN